MLCLTKIILMKCIHFRPIIYEKKECSSTTIRTIKQHLYNKAVILRHKAQYFAVTHNKPIGYTFLAVSGARTIKDYL